MSENTTVQTENISSIESTVIVSPLTAREIFDKITELQRLITESTPHPHEVYILRERTFSEMLALYRKMYEDVSALEVAQNPAMQKQHIIGEMLQIIQDKTSTKVAIEYAKKALDTYILDTYISDK